MKPFSLVCLLATAALTPAVAQNAGPFAGRWDLVVTPKAANAKAYPDWMEVGGRDAGKDDAKDGSTAVRIQPRAGSAFWGKGKVEGTNLYVSWGTGDTTWDLDLKDGKLSGVEKHGAKVFADLAGVPAPGLKRDPPKEWLAAEPIFNGKDLTGWAPTDPAAANHWVAKDGELVNESKGANLKTTRKFDDFNCISSSIAPTTATAASIFAAATRSRWNTKKWTPTTSSTASGASTA